MFKCDYCGSLWTPIAFIKIGGATYCTKKCMHLDAWGKKHKEKRKKQKQAR